MRETGRAPLIVVSALCLFTLALLIGAARGQGGKPPADPHASGRINLPPNTSEVAYCGGCHKDGCPTNHPELATLTWPAQGRVVLGVRGETTCGTCHTRGFRH